MTSADIPMNDEVSHDLDGFERLQKYGEPLSIVFPFDTLLYPSECIPFTRRQVSNLNFAYLTRISANAFWDSF